MAKKTSLTLNAQAASALVSNLLLERSLWLKSLLDPRRDIDAECGHPAALTLQDYLNFYRRGDVAARIVNIWPEESWSERPQVFESEDPEDTEFEKAWKLLEQKRALVPIMARADMLSGIGRFGLILLGFGDGRALDQPLPGLQADGSLQPSKQQLFYVRVFDESCVQVAELESEVTNPRFGFPKMYNVVFQDNSLGTPATVQPTGKESKVHWSRCIHIADNRLSSEIYGLPRIERVVNRVLDLAKIAGGSGEMFWKGGFPGISLETLPEVVKNNNVEIDKEATKEQMEAYMNGLQRYIATIGMKANSLTVNIADPSPHVETQLKLIAIALSIPWRVFVGSEAAQLASEQDIRTWNRRVARRRHDYLTPYVVLPLVQRLIDVGSLPTPKKGLFVDWPDLNSPSDKDKATVAEGLSNAMVKYIAAGGNALMSPFHFLTLVMGMTDEEATSVVDDIDEGLLQDIAEQNLLGAGGDSDGSGNGPGDDSPPAD